MSSSFVLAKVRSDVCWWMLVGRGGASEGWRCYARSLEECRTASEGLRDL
jgi:hypothetical protein